MKNLEQLIENPPANCVDIRDLYNWSTNFEYGDGTPWLAFLDLIGYTVDEYGEKLNNTKWIADYESGAAIGDALNAWSVNPLDVAAYIDAVIEAEAYFDEKDAVR